MAKQRKGARTDYEYEVTATAPRMKSEVIKVKAPSSAEARREAKRKWKSGEHSKAASEVHFSAHRKDR